MSCLQCNSCLSLSQMIQRQLVDAAVDMHAKGVFHRDIKLQNVLVTSDSCGPRVRIIDFGCGTFSTEDTYHSFCGTISTPTTTTICHSLQFWISCHFCLLPQVPRLTSHQSGLTVGSTGPSPPLFGSWAHSSFLCWKDISLLPPRPLLTTRFKSTARAPQARS